MSTSSEQFLTAQELAARLGVSVAFVRKQTLAGLPCHQIGRCVRFDLAPVLEWFSVRATKSKPRQSTQGIS